MTSFKRTKILTEPEDLHEENIAYRLRPFEFNSGISSGVSEERSRLTLLKIYQTRVYPGHPSNHGTGRIANNWQAQIRAHPSSVERSTLKPSDTAATLPN
jgi:hypothetical protein